jgi:hypothetical protein
MTTTQSFIPTSPAEVPYVLEPGWHAILQRIAARDTPPKPPASPMITAVNFPTHTKAGVGGGLRAMPPSRNRYILRAGITVAGAIAEGASPGYIREAVRKGHITLER